MFLTRKDREEHMVGEHGPQLHCKFSGCSYQVPPKEHERMDRHVLRVHGGDAVPTLPVQESPARAVILLLVSGALATPPQRTACVSPTPSLQTPPVLPFSLSSPGGNDNMPPAVTRLNTVPPSMNAESMRTLQD